jgi:hypothetical protein
MREAILAGVVNGVQAACRVFEWSACKICATICALRRCQSVVGLPHSCVEFEGLVRRELQCLEQYTIANDQGILNWDILKKIEFPQLL